MSNIVAINIPQPSSFDFTVPGFEGVHHIPLMEYMPKRLVRDYLRISSMADETAKGTAVNEWMDKVFDRYCPELDLDDQPLNFTQAILEAWGEASNKGVGLGESRDSSDSATSTEPPSTTTSSSTPDAPSMTYRTV